MEAGVLRTAIIEVCPVVWVRVNDASDRASWSYEPTEAATQAEKDAANNVIATIPVEPLKNISVASFLDRWADAEYVKLERERAADVFEGEVALARLWDSATATGTMDFNKPVTKLLKQKLVSDEVLTQARADEIFA